MDYRIKYLITTQVVLLSLFLIINVSGGMNFANESNIKAIEYYNQAIDAASGGNFDQALIMTDKSLEVQPNFTLALVTKAGILINMRRFDESEKILKKAENMSPDNPSVLAAYASLMVETGRNQEALIYADKALQKDTKFIEAWIIKGTAHGAIGQYQEEIEASDKALAIAPNNPLALTNKKYATERFRLADIKPVLDLPQPTNSKQTQIGMFTPLIPLLVLGFKRRISKMMV